jgi:hypothetical protein
MVLFVSVNAHHLKFNIPRFFSHNDEFAGRSPGKVFWGSFKR